MERASATDPPAGRRSLPYQMIFHGKETHPMKRTHNPIPPFPAGAWFRGAVSGLILLVVTVLLAAGPATSGVNELSAYESRFADQDGNPVHYIDTGGGPEAVVFIHGSACNLGFWRHQIPALAARYRVIAIDLPGHGQSGAPQVEYSMEYFAEGVAAVLTKAGVARAVLVGHSMGLPVARTFIRLHPDKAAGLVSIDGVVELVPDDPVEREKWEKASREFAAMFHQDDYEAVVTRYINSTHHAKTPQGVRDEVLAEMLKTPRHVTLSAMDELIKPGNWTADPIDLPALAIYERSEALPGGFQDLLRLLFPRLEYHEIAEAGHFLMLEKTEPINNRLLEFLKNTVHLAEIP